VKAGATQVVVDLNYHDDVLEMTIRDNGCGMDAETVKKVLDPYSTSRTTRKVGL
jgi:signal transduction histidine kinase